MRIGIVLTLMVLSGCAGQREFVAAGTQSAQIAVPPEAAVKLTIPAGEVIVRGAPNSSEVQARVEFSCQVNDRGCQRRVDKARFVTGADTTAILLSLEPSGMMAWHDVQARVEVMVPHDHALFVDMGAGDLDIGGMQNCISLDMYAGDAQMRVAKSVVGSVVLDVGTGDTSLVVDGHAIDGKRALLVGAELDWNRGEGWCQVFGDLQFGDLTVYLDDG